MKKKNTLKDIIMKVLNFLKLFFISIFSIFLSPFTKQKNKQINQKKSLKETKKITPSINEPISSPNESPNTRINKSIFTKEKSEIEQLIIIIYCNILNLKYNELTPIEKQKLNSIINELTPIIDEKIKSKEIASEETLQITIKENINKKIQQNNPNLKPSPTNFKYSPISHEQISNPSITKSSTDNQTKENIHSQIISTDIKAPTKTELYNISLETNLTSNITPTFKPENFKYKEITPTKSKNYISKTKLKNYFVVENLNHKYILIDEQGKPLTISFSHKIIDYQDNYVIIQDKDLYYIYDFQGHIISQEKFLDIKLQEDFYTVVTLNSNLDIHKYNDKKFKLSNPIPLKPENIHNYEVTKEQNKLKIEINTQEIYYANQNTGILENTKNLSSKKAAPPLSINISFNNEAPETEQLQPDAIIENITPSISLVQNLTEKKATSIDVNTISSEKSIEDTKDYEESKNNELSNEQNIIPESQPEIDKKEKQEEISKEKAKDNEKQQNKEEITYDYINFNTLTNELNQITIISEQEINKEELEDKDYEMLETKINYLLEIIKKQEKKQLTPQDRQKLNIEKNKLINLKNKIINAEDLDIEHEKELLNQEIMSNEVFKLELELQQLHLENQIELNEYHLQNIEDLLHINQSEAAKIKKKLLKTKLKKASNALFVSSIISLPFLKNKYFLYFSSALFASTHLNFISNIFKRKNIEETQEELSYIKKGQDALDEALTLTSNNIALLNELEVTALAKYPELSFDNEYLYYLNNLKEQLRNQELKMLRKKQMITKYNLKAKSYTRKLNPNKKAA